MNRHSVNASTDQQYFSRTAKKSKAINLGTKIFRGGIRL